MKFGRPVDLEALQTLSGNRTLEELKQEKLLKEAAYAKEIHHWDVCWPVCAFTSVTKCFKTLQHQTLSKGFGRLSLSLSSCACALQAKVEEAHQALMEVTRCNTARLLSMTSLIDQKRELEHKLNARQKKMVI